MRNGKNGFIKLYRRLLDSPVWQYAIATNYSELIAFWVTLLMMVNYESKKWYDGHKEVTIPAGSIITSNEKLAESMGMSKQTIRTCIKHLENMQMITRQPTRYYTHIFVINWRKYQGQEDGPTHELTSNQHRTNNEVTTTKEYKELKEIIYGENTKAIAELLEVAPTEGLDRYLNDSYRDYKFKNMTLQMVEWCRENKKKPTIARWMNWVRRAEARGELERKGDR